MSHFKQNQIYCRTVLGNVQFRHIPKEGTIYLSRELCILWLGLDSEKKLLPSELSGLPSTAISFCEARSGQPQSLPGGEGLEYVRIWGLTDRTARLLGVAGFGE